MLAVVFVVLGVPWGAASARDTLQGVDCTLPAGQVIEGNLYALCRTLVIDGTVRGDVVAAALSASISGEVQGSVYLAAARMTVAGVVHDDVHFVGGVAHLQPESRLLSPRSSVYSAALSTQVHSPVAGSVTAIGYQLVVDAAVGGDVDFWGAALSISAAIGGDANVSVGDRASAGVSELQTLAQLVDSGITLIPPGLVVTSTGWIGGTLAYSSPSEAEILGTVTQIEYTPVVTESQALVTEQDPGALVAAYLRQVVREWVTLFLIGAFVLLLAPRALQSPIVTIRTRTLPALGIGLLAFILSFPVLLIALMLGLLIVLLVSVLGLEQITLLTASIALVLTLAGAALFFFIALFISRVVIAIALGRLLTRRFLPPRGRWSDAFAHLAAGALLLALIIALPYVGTLVTALTAFLGLGGIVAHLQRPIGRVPAGSGAPPRVPPELPPPPEGAASPGMGDLPEGFNWWR